MSVLRNHFSYYFEAKVDWLPFKFKIVLTWLPRRICEPHTEDYTGTPVNKSTMTTDLATILLGLGSVVVAALIVQVIRFARADCDLTLYSKSLPPVCLRLMCTMARMVNDVGW